LYVIRAYGSDDVQGMRYSLNDGDWKPLEGGPTRRGSAYGGPTHRSLGGGGWFHGFFKLPKLARKRQQLSVQALSKDGEVLTRRDISFVTAVLPEQVALAAKPEAGKGLTFSVEVRDGNRQVLPERKVQFGCFFPISMRESSGTVKTDHFGKATLSCPVAPRETDRYLFVAAGTDSPEKVRTGDMRIYTLGK
jgi:hypothetical protein